MDRVRRGWLSTSPPGTRASAQKKGGRSLLFMRGCFDIAALSRVLRKVALSRPASVATGDFRAPVRRSKLSIRRCRVLPVPTLSSRSFSLFYSFGIIGSRVGREDSPSPTGLRFTASFCERISAVTGSFPFWGLVLLSLEKDVRESTPIRGNSSLGPGQTRFLPPFDRYFASPVARTVCA